jgi:hypothetical protein
MTSRDSERLRLAVRVEQFPPRDVAGEPHTCASVDIQSSRGAPGDELLRVDGRADGNTALGAKLALDGLRLGLPLVERGGERLAVGHDLDDPSVIRASIPRDADEHGGGGQASKHGEFPTVFLAEAFSTLTAVGAQVASVSVEVTQGDRRATYFASFASAQECAREAA